MVVGNYSQTLDFGSTTNLILIIFNNRELMLGVISVVLICHCIYSALRWRKFLQGNSQPI